MTLSRLDSKETAEISVLAGIYPSGFRSQVLTVLLWIGVTLPKLLLYCLNLSSACPPLARMGLGSGLPRGSVLRALVCAVESALPGAARR